MKDEDKTKEQLVGELVEMRRRLNELNARNTQLNQQVAAFEEWGNTFDTFVAKCDENGVMLLCNEAPIRAGGLTAEEVLGKYLPDTHWWAHSEAERTKVVHCFERARTGLSTRIETSFRSADGSPVPIIFTCQPVVNDKGNVEYITVEGKTIIEETRLRVELQKEIENHQQVGKALRESEQKYSTLVESSPTGICIDRDGKILFANDKFAEIYGYSRDELIGIESWRLVHPESRALIGQINAETIDGKDSPTEYEVKGLAKNGETIWITKRNALIEYGGKPAILGNIVDITEHKRAEEHIRVLTQQLIQVEESERRRIARDMHDNVAQDLSTARIACETIFDNESQVPPDVRRRVSRLSKILQKSIVAVRDLAYDLRPLSLDQLGLVRTVFQYCKEFSDQKGLGVDFYSAGMDDLRLDSDTEINLYRVIQEGLSNVRKHADASHVTVKLVASFPKIILRIEDNGKGFDVKDRLVMALDEKRMGLRSMEERVRLLDGKMRIQSRPMLGTRIFIEVPFKENKNGSRKECSGC